MKLSLTLTKLPQPVASSNVIITKKGFSNYVFYEKCPKFGQIMLKSYSCQNETTSKEAWVFDTANKQGRLTGTKVSWKRLGNISDENSRNLFKTKPKKSTICVLESCVVFAVHDMVIDIRSATAGRGKLKISPMRRGTFIKKVLNKKKFEKNRPTKARS